MKALTISTTFLGLALMVGCMVQDKAPDAEQESALRFSAETNKAVVYVYRYGLGPQGTTLRIWLDKEVASAVLDQSFIRLVLQPGRHELAVSNVRNSGWRYLNVDTSPNSIYYVAIGHQLTMANEKEAQDTIRKCTLVKGVKLIFA